MLRRSLLLVAILLASGGVLVVAVERFGAAATEIEGRVALRRFLGVFREVALEGVAALAVARLLDVALQFAMPAFFLVHVLSVRLVGSTSTSDTAEEREVRQ